MNSSVTIGNYIDDLFYNGDSICMELFFVKNAALPIGMILLYVIGSKLIGPKLMENKPAQNLRTSMVVYDVIMMLLNGYMVYHIGSVLSRHGLKQICSVARNDYEEETRMKVIDLVYKIFMLKFLEMIDTVMFIARKKLSQVSNLHVFHHASVPFLVLLSLRSQKRMPLIVYGLVNCFSHVIMYSYYGLSAMGFNVKWKSYVTAVQIVQFMLMIPYLLVISYIGCMVSTSSVIIYLVHTIIMLRLFVNFYKSTFQPSHAFSMILKEREGQFKKLE